MANPTDRNGLESAILASLEEGRTDDYRTDASILSDFYDDDGDGRRADRWRRKSITARSPGLLWPRPGFLADISDHQREQLRFGLTRPVALLTGTPGTGKTFVAARIIGECIRQHGIESVAVVAPTGKAAVRITEALQRCGVPIQAHTMHQQLEIGRNGHDGDGWGFRRHRHNPFDERFIFVEEASMVDADLQADFLDACPPGTHILFIGDPHQLPPVGHGAPLRDMIAAGLPAAQLSEIRRNAGAIVQACAAIKDGKRFEAESAPPDGTVATDDNLFCIETATPERQAAALLQMMGHFHAAGFNLRDQIQVIVPTNKGAELGRHALNAALQAHLNAGGETAEGNPFRVGDKVICTRNGWYVTDDGGHPGPEVYCANGEIGRVVSVTEKLSLAAFGPSDAELIRIPTSKPKKREEDDDESGDFDLAYAITCHKSQGSEWPVVFVMVDASMGARQVCSREWLYTAISRASVCCVLIGRLGVAQMMVQRPALGRRKTFLAERLKERSK